MSRTVEEQQMNKFPRKTHNQILKRYRELAARYWNRANGARVPRVKERWSEMAAFFQEMASRREDHLFLLRHAFEHRARFRAPSPKSDERKTPSPWVRK